MPGPTDQLASTAVQEEDSIPVYMSSSCGTLPLWKLERAKSGDVENEPHPRTMADAVSASSGLFPDDSRTNAYSSPSIITTWDDGTNPRIVTTGNSTGSTILELVKGLKTGTGLPLGVFKVPNHGSPKNNQMDDGSQAQAASSDVDNDHYFFLTCACWYLRSSKLFEDQGVPVEEKSLIYRVVAEILENCAAEWIVKRPGNGFEAKRDGAGFAKAMDHFVRLIFPYLWRGAYQHPKNDASRNLYSDKELWDFAILTAKRHFAILDNIFRDSNAHTPENAKFKALYETNYLEKIQPPFSVQAFFQSDLIRSLVSSEFADASNDPHTAENLDPSLVLLQFKDLCEVLHVDPGMNARYQVGIRDFYRKVRLVNKCNRRVCSLVRHRAINYVILANGVYGHPDPGTIAGIMAVAIGGGQKCRLLISQGSVLQVQRIATIVKALLRGTLDSTPPEEAEWDTWVRVYHLKDDYCGVIPIEQSLGEEWKEISFANCAADQDRLEELRKKFEQTAAYKIRGASDIKISTFRLLITNREQSTMEGLPIAYSGSSFRVGRTPDDDQSLLFYLAKLDIRGTENLYPLVILNNNGYPLAISAVIFLKCVQTSGKTGAKFQIWSQGRALHYHPTPDDDRLLDFPPTPTPSQIVYVSLGPVENFGAAIPGPTTAFKSLVSTQQPYLPGHEVPAVSTASTDSVAPTAVDSSEGISSHILALKQPLEPDELDPKRSAVSLDSLDLESFDIWWNRKKTSDKSLTDCLRDVIRVVLGDLRSLMVLSEIPSAEAGFVFADIGEYQVDTKASPSVHGSEPVSVTCVLTPPRPLPFPGFLDPNKQVGVQSILATVATEHSSLKLDLTMNNSKNMSCSFIFSGESSLVLYLEDIGYDDKLDKLDLASLMASIVGPNMLWSFLRGLPNMLFPEWLFRSQINPRETEIHFNQGPFGPEIKSAIISVLLPEPRSMEMGGVSYQLVKVTAAIKAQGYESFDITLKFIVEFTPDDKSPQILFSAGLNELFTEIASGDEQPKFAFSASLNGLQPIVLYLTAENPTSPSKIVRSLKLENQLPRPPGFASDDEEILTAFVITLSQPYAGSHGYLDPTSIYMYFEGGWRELEELMSKTLPDEFLSLKERIPPEQVEQVPPNKISLSGWSGLPRTVVIPNAKSLSTLGMELDFELVIDPNCSNPRFQLSYYPVTGLEDPFRTNIDLRTDKNVKLDPPTIDQVLQKFKNLYSEKLDESIPILQPILQTTSIAHGSFVINARKVPGFSLSAQIHDLELIPSPSIKVIAGDLIMDYNGTSWSSRLSGQILFANKFYCTAEVVLPRINAGGGMYLRSLTSDFTWGDLIKEIDSRAELANVPIMGNEDLASLPLDKAVLDIVHTKQGIAISNFELPLSCRFKDIGQMKTFGNRLLIDWREDSLTDTIASATDSETTDPTKSWTVRWEGGLFESWHLSVSLRYLKANPTNSIDGVVELLGSISNPRGTIPVNELFDRWSKSSTDSPGQRAVLSDTTPSFHLQDCEVHVITGKGAHSFSCNTRVTWGQTGVGSGHLTINRSGGDSPKSDLKWRFLLKLSVYDFRFTDLVDSDIAEQINEALVIKDTSISVFSYPGNTNLLDMSKLIWDVSDGPLPELGATLLKNLDSESAFGQLVAQTQPGNVPDTGDEPIGMRGVAVSALLSFSSAPPESLTHNLKSIADSELSDVEITGYIGKTVKGESVILFEAFIPSLNLLPFVTFRDIELTYRAGGKSPEATSQLTESGPTNALHLAADCCIRLSDDPEWKIHGQLEVSKESAKLSAKLTSGSLEPPKAWNPLGLRLGNITFTMDYVFSGSSINSSETFNADDGPGDRTVETRSSHLKDVSLAGEATVGSFKAEVSFLFDSFAPVALRAKTIGTGAYKISELFHQILGDGFPKNLLDLEFSEFEISYVWKDVNEPKDKPLEKGFHTNVKVSVFGISFDLSLDIQPGQGIKIPSQMTKSITLLGITIHGQPPDTGGPRFEYETKTKSCSLKAGLTVFKTAKFSPLNLKYEHDSKKPRFSGDVHIPDSFKFIPKGGATVKFELVKVNGKYVFRFVDFPAFFTNLINYKRIYDIIDKLRKGDKCGIFEEIFKQLMKFKVHAKLNLPDSQKGFSPEDPNETVRSLVLEVHGSLEVTLGDESLGNIEFNKIPIEFLLPNIPETFEEFEDGLFERLEGASEQILESLLLGDNRENLEKAILLIIAKKAIPEAISKMLCRKELRRPDPEDPAKPEEQKPSGKDGANQLKELLDKISRTLSGLCELVEGILQLITAGFSLLAALFKVLDLGSDRNGEDPTPRKRPPPFRPLSDPLSHTLKEALSKDFDRWEKCTEYAIALETTRDCALDYRAAIYMLAEVLASRNGAPLLGNHVYNYYHQELEALQFEFTSLGERFGKKWLDMSDHQIRIIPHSSQEGFRLEVSWDAQHLGKQVGAIVKTKINEESSKGKFVEGENKTFIDIPQSGGTKNFKITVSVLACDATMGDGKSGAFDEAKYGFFSLGEPAHAVMEVVFDSDGVPFYLTHQNTGSKPKLPPLLEDLSYHASVEDVGQYPVLIMGNTTWWPIRYKGDREELAVLGFDSANKLVRAIGVEKVPLGHIGGIRVITDLDNKGVQIYDTEGKGLTTIAFSLFSVNSDSV
ncbi:unnamed protein product [Rhizoctonia solani]|uniref:Uncharacterized protein n=1 Tax=Rhizoctonia solani TaxID=456999 RepID=A0A8H3GLU4_9AGAM|nr:unnamed protein product [Rhizoctonia solani]